MSSMKDSIKDCLGATVQLDFWVPYTDDSQVKPDTTVNFGDSSSSELRTGLVIDTQGSAIKLLAAFKGQIFFQPIPASTTTGSLSLVLLPLGVLSLRTLLSEDVSVPVQITYAPVDTSSVKTAVQEALKAQGITGSTQTDVLDDFLAGYAGIMVKAGASLGEAYGTSLRLTFEDIDGAVLNPEYLLWSWSSLAQTGSTSTISITLSSHSLLSTLNLKNRTLTLKDGSVYETSKLIGPYSFIIP